MTALAKTFYLQHEAKTDCSYNNIAILRDCPHFPQKTQNKKQNKKEREKKVQNRRVYKSTNVHQEATVTRVLLFLFVCLLVFVAVVFVVGWLLFFASFMPAAVGAGEGGGGERENIHNKK